ncbi:MAG: RNA methyltransferase [Muribaculaceae bacterium]|nr:RNA methyltransferase [Muribaculaceae bacterium]
MIIEIKDIDDGRVADYTRLTEAALRSRLNPDDARIIVESPKVIKVALQSGLTPKSILCERKHIDGDAAEVISMSGDVDVYTSDRHILAELTGYTLTRGVLSCMKRPADKRIGDILEEARRICILAGVCDSTNIGAIFRSAAALGIDAVLLTRSCCDPYNRRAIRVSMGSVFLVPWSWIDDINEVADYGFVTVAMALRHDSVELDDPMLKIIPRLALIMGTEGDGLADEVIFSADYVVRIPMSHNVDSLNVAAASAVAFWELSCKH